MISPLMIKPGLYISGDLNHLRLVNMCGIAISMELQSCVPCQWKLYAMWTIVLFY